MHLRTEVIGLRVRVFTEPEHGREGGQAQHFDRFAQVKAAGDKHAGRLAGHGGETVGTREARAIQKR
jgi:hypothetical protein